MSVRRWTTAKLDRGDRQLQTDSLLSASVVLRRGKVRGCLGGDTIWAKVIAGWPHYEKIIKG